MTRPILVAVASLFSFSFGVSGASDQTQEQPAARHDRVAERRCGIVIICHRGALEFAHENTLEAFRASLELGADGNEIDIRATSDGVLVCFHDDMLDSILEAYGDIADFPWADVASFPFRNPGPFGIHCRIPTLREALDLHRRFAGLIQLDVKRPGYDRQIARLLTELDMWDHVVGANTNCSAIIEDPRYRPVRYKASLYLDRRDVDHASIVQGLQRPGQAVMVEDPRGVLTALGRTIGTPSGIPLSPRQGITMRRCPTERAWPIRQLIDILNDDADWDEIAETEASQAASGRRITARARAADELARRGVRSAAVVAALSRRVRLRSLHKSWRYHGLDGAAAMRSLIRLKAPQAVDLARFCLWRDDEAVEAIRNPKFQTPRSWVDFRVKMLVFRELESLPGKATQTLCRSYLALDESAARAIGPVQYEAAARTLLAVSPCEATAGELLAHKRIEVRGRTILFCLGRAHEIWALELLKEKAPHTLSYVIREPTPRP